MKICYIAHRTNLNGASRSLLDLIDGLDRSQYEPVVMVNGKGPLLDELDKRNVPYVFAPLVPSLNADNPVLDFVKRTLNKKPFYSLFLVGIKRRLKQVNPDIVHNNTLLCTIGMQAAKDLNIPYICHYRELLWEGHHRELIRVCNDHELMKSATVSLYISHLVKEKYLQYTSKERFVIHDGIHTDLYDLPAHDILSGNTVTLLLAGRIHPGKGQLDAVKAVELARTKTDKDLRLIILGTIGDERYTEKLKAYVGDHKLDFVSIESFTKDLSSLREHCDIGLTCSYSEGLGRVTIENMLSSLLVIAANSGATPEIVTDRETGLLYQAGNIEDFAEKILYAIEHVEQGREIADSGHDYAVASFNHVTYAKAIQQIYDTIPLHSK